MSRKTAKLPSTWSLVKQTTRQYWRTKWRVLWLVIVVQIPAVLLTGFTGNSGTINAYTNLATLFMDVALIMTVGAQARGEARPSLKTAYYDGSRFVVRFLLTSAALLVMIIPALLALIVYGIGVSGIAGAYISLGEQIIIGLFCLLLALPTIWLMVRYLLAPTLVVAADVAPIAALKLSRNVSLGHFWRVLARLVILLILLIVLVIIIGLPVLLLSAALPGLTALFSGIGQTLFTLIALPLCVIYLVQLYLQLDEARRRG